MKSILPDAVRVALHAVACAAREELNHGAGCRKLNNPLTVSNLGLARRFERMSDGELLRQLRYEEADVAHLVFYGLYEVLNGENDLVRSLTVEQLGHSRVSFGTATAAALRAVEHYDRSRNADVMCQERQNRIAQYLR